MSKTSRLNYLLCTIILKGIENFWDYEGFTDKEFLKSNFSLIRDQLDQPSIKELAKLKGAEWNIYEIADNTGGLHINIPVLLTLIDRVTEEWIEFIKDKTIISLCINIKEVIIKNQIFNKVLEDKSYKLFEIADEFYNIVKIISMRMI